MSINDDYVKLCLSGNEELTDVRILNYIEDKLQKSININDEDEANKYWYWKSTLLVKQNYFKVFELFKDNKFEEAWNLLENIEKHITIMLDNVEDCAYDFGVKYIQEKVNYIQKLFPYSLFFSREMVVLESHCSICEQKNSIRKSCHHIPGKLYMGKICQRIITKADLLGVSIVSNPKDKYAIAHINKKEYNYELLKYFLTNINDPYDDFVVEESYVLKVEYQGIDDNSICPCGSKIAYKDCCKGTSSERIVHKNIILKHKPNGKITHGIINTMSK